MQKWYIYFNENGKIYSVTNEKKQSGTFFETSEDNVKDFISGKKQLDCFTVKLNENKKYKVLENKNLFKLKFCNLENLTIENIQTINFETHKLLLFVCYKDKFNFLEGTYTADSADLASSFISNDKTVFYQRVLK